MNSTNAEKVIRVSNASLGVLTGIIIVAVSALLFVDTVFAATTRQNFTKARISIIEDSLFVFKKDVGRFPSSEEGLSGLLSAPKGILNWNGPYVDRDQIPKDGWNNEFIYRHPPKLKYGDFDLYSPGPNGVDESGKGDDIVNCHQDEKHFDAISKY